MTVLFVTSIDLQREHTNRQNIRTYFGLFRVLQSKEKRERRRWNG